jgi:hypothetical protein
MVFITYILSQKFGVFPSSGAKKQRNLLDRIEQKKLFSVSGYSLLACSERFFAADKRKP